MHARNITSRVDDMAIDHYVMSHRRQEDNIARDTLEGNAITLNARLLAAREDGAASSPASVASLLPNMFRKYER